MYACTRSLYKENSVLRQPLPASQWHLWPPAQVKRLVAYLLKPSWGYLISTSEPISLSLCQRPRLLPCADGSWPNFSSLTCIQASVGEGNFALMVFSKCLLETSKRHFQGLSPQDHFWCSEQPLSSRLTLTYSSPTRSLPIQVCFLVKVYRTFCPIL